MPEVVDWLKTLGMPEYAERFAESDIDTSVLCELTDQDLKELGVSLGHRRKMLRAIAELVAVPPTQLQPALTEPKPKDTAERRQVTVMFSDLVGSTALAARMDPEDLREVISAYQKCVAETVDRFDGFVAKYMGDGVLVYFGYPQAHEDDAERAVRAGLELIAAVGRLKSSAPLQTRVGIATGLVVVGDLIGSGAAQEQAVVGETPNIAARLQGVAEPNTVAIAESTRKLLGNLFELEDLGPKDLKGIAQPVRAWAALRTSSAEGRFEALHGSGLTALVGREEELELLLRRWSKAKTGEGQVVLLSGEAGIGKSRLTAALLERLAAEPHTRLRYFCSPQHTDSALYPIIGQMERAAGLAHDDIPQAKLDKLDAVLAQTATASQDAALFAELLSLPNDGRYPALDLAPEPRRQRTLEALTKQLAGLASQNPVLMIFEDAHWTDPTSLEAFGRTVHRIKTLPALLIVTFRPEFNAPWAGRSHVTSQALNRLGEREAAAIIARLVGNKELPADVMAEIVERTDGIPLFVEEMTKAVLEVESEGEARPAGAVPSPALAVPASLHASLMARLDRLGPAKEVAQIGAAIGRDFSHPLLAAVVRKPEAELGSALDCLIAAGLLFRQGVSPHATYLFKHALVRDAAYGCWLRSQRQALHARIGSILEGQFPNVVEQQPAILAQHWTEAGSIERAIAYWTKAAQISVARAAMEEAVVQLRKALALLETRFPEIVAAEPQLVAQHCTEVGLNEKAVNYRLKAGQQAIARSAMAEAEALLRRGLALIASLPDNDWREEQQLDLLITLGRALAAAHGWGAPETGEIYARARELCDRLNRPRKLLPILYGRFVHHALRADLDKAQELAAEMRRLGETQNDVVARVVAYRVSGYASLAFGDFVTACDYLERSLGLYNPTDRAIFAELTPQDFLPTLLSFLACALVCSGHLDQARSRRDAALTEARRLSHAYTSANASWWDWYVGWIARSEPGALLQSAEKLLALSVHGGIAFWRAMAIANRGWCLAALGHPEQGIPLVASGLREYHATGNTQFTPLLLTTLADAHRIAGNPQTGLKQLAEAERLAEATRERIVLSETLRLRGDLLLLTDDHGGAEASFTDAIAVARRQAARLFELRATTSLARLWRDQDKCAEARDLLAPIYGWFTEGFDTLDLKEAKALLDELNA